jgi:orotate phosphoribosyltransferase-like protein
MLTREQVEHAGQDLASRGLPAGERSIALELGVSRDAVRYALGKDQRRRPQS